eukprot:6240020-Prymnesium_polylepis.1
MPPAQTAPAAVYSDATNRAAAARVLRVADSPCARAELALDRAQQDTRDGGLGLSCYSRRARASHATSPPSPTPGRFAAASTPPSVPSPPTHPPPPPSLPSATPTRRPRLSPLDVRCH